MAAGSTGSSVQFAAGGEIEIAYETFGSRDDPMLVLIAGVSSQLLGWDVDFCRELAGHGFRVVRFDNRDVGLSTHLHEAGVPDLTPLLRGEPIAEAPYLLADMAQDVVDLLDVLGVERAHIVGLSMGGMIAQEVAAHHPDRTLSLTSIMSTSSPAIGAPTPEAAAALLAPPATTEKRRARVPWPEPEFMAHRAIPWMRPGCSPPPRQLSAGPGTQAGLLDSLPPSRPPVTEQSDFAGSWRRPWCCTVTRILWCSCPAGRQPPRRSLVPG
ncbi:putative esterase [Microlunatus phosphovorus NM-1]|uniref:Putative esterase n=1 Tax=Microlunatus phosphovorus (strain ATCC 700054 / DSM 10555 / JCM 9379 / NBRC 101784 / NCIMB 13414 / VKM Ac-1990 / NM-1) TaxID=1032480 RepID=F5XHW5_MICPN|nr:alpha/beta hydrolase [Microlunatus phosphovorus]BAK33260.1 putative esterase [Microlunatus phosphovorus NM-1]